MDYQLVKDTVDQLSQRGWASFEIAQADGYPIFRLSSEPDSPGGSPGESPVGSPAAGAPRDGAAPAATARPVLLIAAGIHGEEPGGVVGLCRWLLECSDRWMDRLRFVVFPCLNPWGFERGIRFAADGKDLNRQFHAPEHPSVAAFCRYLEASPERFPLFMDLHEDCDFEAMYLYEVIDAPSRRSGAPTLGRRILERARRSVALYSGTVEDLEAQDGMIRVDALERQKAREFRGAPIALFAYAHGIPHVVTVETPGRLALDVRASLQVEALEEACGYLLEGGLLLG